jgi:membrane fusion protein (multidrug efflux system)
LRHATRPGGAGQGGGDPGGEDGGHQPAPCQSQIDQPAELDVSRAEVEKTRAELAIADAAASKCEIAAPFNGVTVEQKAQEFQYASPGQPLLEILDDRSLEVELIAPSRGLAWLKPGYAFQVHIEETDKTYPAEITRVGGRVDPVTQTIKIFGEIRGDAAELMAGMSGRANIPPPQK